MTEIELIAKQQIEIEELKQEIGYLKDCAKEAMNELIYCEQLNIKNTDFPKVAMSVIVTARQMLED